MNFKAFALLACLLAFVTGCKTETFSGGKIVEGTDISVGVALPSSVGNWQIDFFNYLSGFRFGFTNNARVECEYKVVSTTTFCGVYENKTEKDIRAVLEPTVDEQTDEGSGGQTETADCNPPADGAGDGTEGNEAAPNTEERTAE